MSGKPRRLHLGVILPAALVVILAGPVVAASAASASPHQPGGVAGVVTSVNGSDASVSACVSSDTGTFTMVGHIRQGIVTVDVAATTTYTDAALTPPTSATYADVCVGDQVKVLGTLSSGALAATEVTIVPAQAQGIVTSVNSVATADTCGTTLPGSFTLAARHHDIVTVDVTSASAFTDAALTPPTSATYADVCVGDQVKVLGTLSSGALAATAVTIVPAYAQGIVASVNGVATAGTCGAEGLAGSFTLGGFRAFPVTTAAPRFVSAVDVTSTTTFSDAALTTPTSASFAYVCVGSQVTALGTLSSGALAATLVTIVPAQAQGTVTSVTVEGGTTSTTAGSCGTGGSAGTFTVGGVWALPMAAAFPQRLTTVDVTTTTAFTDALLAPPTSATFANVCVGNKVTALGTLSSGALAATLVTIVPAETQGIVTSVTVGGTTSTTAGACGTTGSAGSFTVAGIVPIGIVPLPVAAIPTRLLTTVDVASTTTFTDATLATPTSATFANVCVGDHVEAIGTLSSGVLAATAVTILPPISFAPGHGNRRG